MIDEPVTVVTDLGLSALAGILGGRLLRARGARRIAVRLWGGGLIGLAAAALAGGLWHAIGRSLQPSLAAGLWRVTLASLGIASFLFCAASLRATLTDRAARAGTRAAAAMLVLYGIALLEYDVYALAIAAYAPAMLVALLLPGRRGNRAIAAGVAVTVAGSLVQLSGFSLHERFNHNDLYHLIQMVAVVLFFRGGRALSDFASPPRHAVS